MACNPSSFAWTTIFKLVAGQKKGLQDMTTFVAEKTAVSAYGPLFLNDSSFRLSKTIDNTAVVARPKAKEGEELQTKNSVYVCVKDVSSVFTCCTRP